MALLFEETSEPNGLAGHHFLPPPSAQSMNTRAATAETKLTVPANTPPWLLAPETGTVVGPEVELAEGTTPVLVGTVAVLLSAGLVGVEVGEVGLSQLGVVISPMSELVVFSKLAQVMRVLLAK